MTKHVVSATSKAKRATELEEIKQKDRQLYINKLRMECEPVGYPGGTMALYDALSDTYFNSVGQKLKRPEDYSADNDGRYY